MLLEEECGCLTVEDGVGYAVEYSLCRWHDVEDYWLLLSGICKFASYLVVQCK